MKTELEKWKKDHRGFTSVGSEKEKHYYHEKTGDHWYDGHAWSKELWDSFVNEECY